MGVEAERSQTCRDGDLPSPPQVLTCSVKVASFSRNCTTQYASCGVEREMGQEGSRAGPGHLLSLLSFTKPLPRMYQATCSVCRDTMMISQG